MTSLLLNGNRWVANGAYLRRSRMRICEVADWSHSWDAVDATVVSGRATRVENRSNSSWPLLKDAGAWGGVFALGALPGPQHTWSDSKFGGRPSLYTDIQVDNGGFFDIFSLLATTLTPTTDSSLFNSGQGYDMPYVIAVLARPTGGGGNSIWDSYREGAPTLTTGAIDQTHWGATTGLSAPNAADTVADLWPVTSIAYDTAKTVLVVGYFNAASSWLEVVQRTTAGVVRTREAIVLTDRNPSANPLEAGFREGFIGFVSQCYWSATAIKLGAVSETDVTNLVSWASPFLPV